MDLRCRIGVVAAVGAVLVAVVVVGVGKAGYRVNLTPSMPLGVYRVGGGELRRGSWVEDCLPAAVARVGLRRGYLERGWCRSSGAMAVVKIVAAIGGDVVRRTSSGVIVDGRIVSGCSGGALRVDPSGRPLSAIPARSVVPLGSVYLCGITRLSWDSRYYGPVPVGTVRGIAVPVAGETVEPPRRQG